MKKTIFEEEFRTYPNDQEPLLSFNLADGLMIAGFIGWGVLMFIHFA